MTRIESTSVSVSSLGAGALGRERARTVVWVRGEHDIATRAELERIIAQAAGLDDADIVVDLSGVTFMDASTIGAFVGARNRLRSHSRTLSLRNPSLQALRVLDLCGLARRVDRSPRAPWPVARPRPTASCVT